MNNQKEVWLPVKGYEGFYEVSNLGRLKGVERSVKHPKGGYRVVKEKFFKLNIDSCGYYTVRLSSFGFAKSFRIHVLVCESFLNHTPDGFNLVIDHIDNDKLNNSLHNLQIVTNRYNSTKDKKIGTSRHVGVTWSKNHTKWKSCIYIGGKSKHLGYFDCELAAAKAYNDKLKEINK